MTGVCTVVETALTPGCPVCLQKQINIICILIPPHTSCCNVPFISVHKHSLSVFLLRDVTLYGNCSFSLPRTPSMNFLVLFFPMFSPNSNQYTILLAVVPCLYTKILLKSIICLFKIPKAQLRIRKNFQWEYKETGNYFTSRDS